MFMIKFIFILRHSRFLHKCLTNIYIYIPDLTLFTLIFIYFINHLFFFIIVIISTYHIWHMEVGCSTVTPTQAFSNQLEHRDSLHGSAMK